MPDIVIETACRIIGTIILSLLGVLSAYWSAKLAKRAELANLSIAMDELIRQTQITVGELQQTLVDDLKAASLDGKLSEEEITALGTTLYNHTKRKLAPALWSILDAAGVDIQTAITSIAEDWIREIREPANGEQHN